MKLSVISYQLSAISHQPSAIVVLALITFALPLTLADPTVKKTSPVDHVLILSLDGARPDVMLKADMTHCDALMKNGAYSLKAKTILPSVTLPSHASMLTGVLPSVHNITWNNYDPQRGYVQVPTVFELAKEAGLSTAMVVGKEKLVHLAKPGTVDLFRFVPSDASSVAKVAADHVVHAKPNLIFVHFSDPDAIGHTYGWDSPEQVKAMENCDEALGLMLKAFEKAGIWRKTVIIISADHGGHNKGHGSDDPLDVTIPWICSGAHVRAVGELKIPVSTCDTAATAAYALGLPIPKNWTGKPIKQIFNGAIQLRKKVR